MGALIAILQNDPTLLRCQVQRLEQQVDFRTPDRAPDALGFGYFQGNDVLLGKRPNGAPASFSLAQLIGAISSEALLIHARHATVGASKDENTHPFRFRRWLFAHDGTIEGFPLVKPRILEALPDFLRRNVAGETDSEHAFMLFLKYMRESGHLDDLDLEAATAGQALARVIRDLEGWSREAGAARPSVLNFVATDGRVLAATCRGHPLHYALLEGIFPCPREGIGPNTPESDPRLRPHRQVKAVCIATQVRKSDGFRPVPEGSVLSVGRTLQVAITALGDA